VSEEPDRLEESIPPPGAERVGITGSEPPTSSASSPPVPLDTDDTRGHHFRRLSRHPITLSLGLTAAIAAFVVLATQVGPAAGAAGAVAAALLTLAIVFALASSRAEEDFFIAYAVQRGLQRLPDGRLPPTTPLLRKGDKRYAEQIMDGGLPGGMAGTLALYTYEEHRTDGEGNRQTDYYRFTLVMHDLPQVAYKLSDLHCERRSGFRFMDSAEDAFRRMQRLELESEALDRRYEIFFGPSDDELWMKQLFSPSFIVWLAEGAPKDFAFELSAGGLCANVKGHQDSAAELDELCEAAATVARRLSEEAAE
jgi:hypothetical protein